MSRDRSHSRDIERRDRSLLGRDLIQTKVLCKEAKVVYN